MHSKGGVQLSQLGFAACQSKNCTNQRQTSGGCSCLNCTNQAILNLYLVGAFSIWLVHLRQVHPLKTAPTKQSTLKGVQLSQLHQQYKSTKLKAMACAIAF